MNIRLHQLLFATTLIFCASVVASVQALQIDYSIDQAGTRIAQTAHVVGKEIYIRALGGEPNQALYFDAANEILYLLYHARREYVQIDNPTIDKVASMIEAVSGTVGSPTGGFADLLKSFGLGDTQPAATTTKTNRSVKVAGYPCQIHRTSVSDQMVSEHCMAEANTMTLPPLDLLTVQTFLEFGMQMVLRANKLLAILGMDLPRIKYTSSGVPLALYTAKNNTEVRVSRIDPDAGQVPDDPIPKDFTRARLPFVSR